MKVLLIEDDPYILKMYQTKFTREGFEVHLADNGQRGLDALRQHGADVVLLDLMMPELDGFEVLRIIRESPQWAGLPVIVLSNIAQELDIQRARDLGATDYYVKSQLTPAEVVEKIHAVVGDETGK